MSLNRVILQGSIPKGETLKYELKNENDPEKAVLSFLLSVRRNYKPEGAQYAEEDLIQVKMFGKKAIAFNKFFKRGNGVQVEGELQRETYEKDGVKQYSTVVRVSEFYFFEGTIDKKGEATDAVAEKTASAPAPRTTAAAPAAAAKFNLNLKKAANA